MWYTGFLDLSAWQLIVATLALTHVTIVSVTVYLHRYSAHRSLELHPALKHFFRFWLWLTTAMNTREWTAIHRKHHAKCETPDDPHSPVHKGLGTVLRKGAELYMAEAKNEETLRIYGKNCPDDWIERNLYSRFPNLGIVLMLANLVPWGILIGGEELHNNHHTYPNSAKLSVRKWEFDMGWAWIRLFSLLGLAKVTRVAPIAHRIEGKGHLDMDSAMAILNNRFQIMAQYRKLVIVPLVRQELGRVDASVRHQFRRAKRLLAREPSLLQDEQQAHISAMLEQSQPLQVIYEKRLALQQIWTRTSSNGQEMLAAIRQWVQEAEASGIQSLREFAEHLKTYSLRPAPASA